MSIPSSSASTTVSGAEKGQVVIVSYPVNTLKQKLGNGGFEYQRLLKAEQRLRQARQEFPFIAQRELQKINSALYYLREKEASDKPESHWLSMIFAASIELKANSSMFSYSIINMISESMLYFTEYLKTSDAANLQIIELHYDALHLVFEHGHDAMDDEQRDELLNGLQVAILQYRNGAQAQR